MRPSRRLGPGSAALLLIGWLLATLAWAGSAQAEPPLDIDGAVTDRQNVLGSDRAEVDRALRDFFDDTGLQLFVVYVDDFDGLDGDEWADATAEESGIGAADLLLAVATVERSYGFSVPNGGPISDGDLERVDRELVLPQLRDLDWAGAAVAAAEGFTDAASGGLPWGWIVLGTGAAVGGGALAVRRVRRRYDRTHVVRDEHGDPVDPISILDTDELDAKASRDLVAVDDALKTSEQELGFAEAQFGDEATAAFRTVVNESKARLREAFAIRQRLDDSDPEPDDVRRSMAAAIVTTCAEIDAALDAQVEDFDRLRDLVTRAPEVLAALPGSIDAARARLSAARETLVRLAAEHGHPAVVPVTGNPDQAEALLVAAEAEITEGQTAVSSAESELAARHTRAAEHGVAQATTLLDAIDRAAEDLAAVAQQRDEVRADLARVTGQVKAVSDFIETRRGAVGAEARTRLAEAARQLDIAQRALDTDHQAAANALQRATYMADDAQRLAENDTTAHQRRTTQTAPSSHGSSFDSMVLGGILGDVISSGFGGSSRSSSRSSSSRRSSSSSRSTSSRRSSSSRSSSSSSRRSRGGRF